MSDNSQLDEFLTNMDRSNFNTDSYVRRTRKPWGWELHFTPDNLPYMGKVLHLDEGAQTSLQVHNKKQESWLLMRGNVSVFVDQSDGEMAEIQLSTESGYTIEVGQKHRLVGGTGGGDVLEVSTPESGTTFRIEDDHNRPDETEEKRQYRNENLTDAR